VYRSSSFIECNVKMMIKGCKIIHIINKVISIMTGSIFTHRLLKYSKFMFKSKKLLSWNLERLE